MGFLNNSGDIILDAVLTDDGRQRLAKGDGTFKITSFALGDDEIDYSQWDGSNSSGSAYYDLNILQTPILEAFTNNGSSMKSKLVSYSSTDILYLPITMLNVNNSKKGFPKNTTTNTYIGIVNKQDIGSLTSNATVYGYTNTENNKFIAGNFDANAKGSRNESQMITLDQGLNTDAISYKETLEAIYDETGYIITMDNRLCFLVGNTSIAAGKAQIDDDNMASYIVTPTANQAFFTSIDETPDEDTTSLSVLKGPYSRNRLKFSLSATTDLKYSDYYFTTFGNTNDTTDGSYSGKNTVLSLDTNIQVVGLTTGYRIDIPVRLVKFKGV